MDKMSEIQKRINHALEASDADALIRAADELDMISTTAAQARAYQTRGIAIGLRGDYPSALPYFERALALYTEIGNQVGRANITNNIGLVHNSTGQYLTALQYYRSALALFEEVGARNGVANVTGNIGLAHLSLGDLDAALNAFQRALVLHTDNGSKGGQANCIGNIGRVLRSLGDYPAALDAYHRALSLLEVLGDRSGIATNLTNIGSVYQSTGDYPSALDYCFRALAIHEEIGHYDGMARVIGTIGVLYMNTGDHDAAREHFTRSQAILESIDNREGVALSIMGLGSLLLSAHDHRAALEHFRRAHAIFTECGDAKGIAQTSVYMLSAYVSMGATNDALAVMSEIDGMTITDPTHRVEYLLNRARLWHATHDLDAAARSLREALQTSLDHGLRSSEAEAHKALRDLALAQNDFAGYVEHNNVYTRITEEINGKEITTKLALQAKQREIDAREKEHQKHMAVLHSTLPKEVAERVARGEVVNDHFENATVIFLDIVGFTEISSSLSSQDVIQLLDDVFTQCDEICARHGVTKIKTIGDSYMAVGFDSVTNAADCALAMSRVTSRASSREASRVLTSREASRATPPDASHEVEFRIGIHCGPVTAGVIGKERMQYDVWGDTVNIASRMESSGLPGRVHITQAVVNAIENHAIENREYRVEERGMVDVKGKGMMRTYWLESKGQ